jgi:hypothetical protein
VAHAIDHARQQDGAPEDLALVDQVGETAGVLLGLELVAGPIALALELRLDRLAQLTEEGRAHGVLEHDVAVTIELVSFLLGHGRVRSA